MENKHLEKIVATVLSKEEMGTRTSFVSHNEDHSYQGVLVNYRVTRFNIDPDLKYRHESNAPLASDAKFLDFILGFDISRWTDVADPELKEKYKETEKKFIDECNKIHADNFIEINYSIDLRLKHIKSVNERREIFASDVPLVYYPFSFETCTSSYTREDDIPPEVISVKIIEKPKKIFNEQEFLQRILGIPQE